MCIDLVNAYGIQCDSHSEIFCEGNFFIRALSHTQCLTSSRDVFLY